MGISGLLQALRDVMDPVSAEDLRGQTAAIDAFSWLHKGVYACSAQLCLGEPTTKYIKYIMDKIDMLLAVGVTPLMVFDGDYLPMKGGKEDERAASRKKNLARGLSYLKDGNSRAAHNCFVKAVDVTPEMAFEVIKVGCWRAASGGLIFVRPCVPPTNKELRANEVGHGGNVSERPRTRLRPRD